MGQSELIIFGHRGCAAEAPENTLASFALALEQGCNAIELDIHLSADGELIVCHDRTLDRTTDKQGRIREMTVKEIKQADAGSWFHERFAGERIPLLEEVLELVPRGIILNIEIKEACDGELEPKLLALLQRHDRVAEALITSFDFKSLCRVKRLAPDIRIGLTYSCNYPQHYALTSLVDVPVYSLHPNFRRIDKQDVTEAQEKGCPVYAYTLNTAEDLREALALGVSGVITDCPGKMREWLSEFNSKQESI